MDGIDHGWRSVNPKPENKPTIRVAISGFEYALPQIHHHRGKDYSAEIVPGLALHGDIITIERHAHDYWEAAQAALKEAGR